MGTDSTAIYYKIELENCTVPFKQVLTENLTETLQMIRLILPNIEGDTCRLIITSKEEADLGLIKASKKIP